MYGFLTLITFSRPFYFHEKALTVISNVFIQSTHTSSMIVSHTLVQDWFGTAIETPIHIMLELKPDELNFSVLLPLNSRSHPASQPKTFFPGLWKYDVAELFIAGTNGRYLEINLSPNGAWWAGWFSAPRISHSRAATPKILTSVVENTARLKLCRSALDLLGPIDCLRWNTTAIVNSPEQQFLTRASLPGAKPDFHQPNHFLPWESLR